MRPGEIVAGLGGLVLLVALLMPWYGDATAWEAMSVIDILLALAAVVALALPVVSASSKGPAKPIGHAVIATVTSALATLLVLFRLLDDPGPLRAGAWLGLAGVLAALAGAWLAMRDESTPGAAPPDVPRRPVPPPNITPDAEP
jgi:hypothetical protein